jgi:hypothetical protein
LHLFPSSVTRNAMTFQETFGNHWHETAMIVICEIIRVINN